MRSAGWPRVSIVSPARPQSALPTIRHPVTCHVSRVTCPHMLGIAPPYSPHLHPGSLTVSSLSMSAQNRTHGWNNNQVESETSIILRSSDIIFGYWSFYHGLYLIHWILIPCMIDINSRTWAGLGWMQYRGDPSPHFICCQTKLNFYFHPALCPASTQQPSPALYISCWAKKIMNFELFYQILPCGWA